MIVANQSNCQNLNDIIGYFIEHGIMLSPLLHVTHLNTCRYLETDSVYIFNLPELNGLPHCP